MGVTPLRLLITSAALVVGAALMPAMAAVASPEPFVATVVQQAHSEREVAALTLSEARLDAVAQHTADGGRVVADELPKPPLWLLVLLVPILVGGAIGTGVTLRRLR